MEQLVLALPDQILYLAPLLQQEEATVILEVLAALEALVVLAAVLFAAARLAREILQVLSHHKETMAGLEAPTPSQIAYLVGAAVLERPEIQMDWGMAVTELRRQFLAHL